MQWQVVLNVIAVATTFSLLSHVSRASQVDHDSIGGAFGHIQRHSNIAQPSLRVVSDDQQGPRMSC